MQIFFALAICESLEIFIFSFLKLDGLLEKSENNLLLLEYFLGTLHGDKKGKVLSYYEFGDIILEGIDILLLFTDFITF